MNATFSNPFAKVHKIIRLNFAPVFFFELLFRFVFTSIFMYTGAHFIRLAISLSGYSYVTTANLLNFLAKPTTIIIFIFLFMLLALCIFFESCVLFTAFREAANNKKYRLRGLLLRGLRSFCAALKKNFIPTAFASTQFFILFNLYLILPFFRNIRPVASVINNVQDFFPLWAVLLLFLGVILLLTPFLFPFFIAAFEGQNPGRAFMAGLGILKRHFFKILFLIIFWNIILFLIYKFLYSVLLTFFSATIVFLSDSAHTLSLVLLFSDRLEFVLACIMMSFGMMFSYPVIVYYYYKYRGNNALPYIFTYEYHAPKRSDIIIRRILFIMAFIGAVFSMLDFVVNGSSLAEYTSVAQISAHRAGAGYAPENTIAAIEYSVSVFADYAEIDVQETKDGVVILLHDTNLKRTTGKNANVWSLTYGEILELDAGSYYNEEYSGTKIPTLEEALIASKGRINLNIELKSNGHDENLAFKVAELITRYNMEEQCVISSFNYQYLLDITAVNPDIKVGYIVYTAVGDYISDDNIDFFSFNSSMLSQSVVDAIHLNGKQVHAWTVNSSSEINRMKLIGVDNIITDDPALVRDILYSESGEITLIEYLRMLL